MQIIWKPEGSQSWIKRLLLRNGKKSLTEVAIVQVIIPRLCFVVSRWLITYHTNVKVISIRFGMWGCRVQHCNVGHSIQTFAEWKAVRMKFMVFKFVFQGGVFHNMCLPCRSSESSILLWVLNWYEIKRNGHTRKSLNYLEIVGYHDLMFAVFPYVPFVFRFYFVLLMFFCGLHFVPVPLSGTALASVPVPAAASVRKTVKKTSMILRALTVYFSATIIVIDVAACECFILAHKLLPSQRPEIFMSLIRSVCAPKAFW